MKERDISFYLDQAKAVNGFKSDRQLDIAMGFKGSMTSYLRNGKSGISDEKMIELAKLAGISPFVALTDLNTWRTTGAAKEAYKELLKKITATVILAGLVSLFLLIPDRAQAHTMNALSFPDNSAVNTEIYIITSERKNWLRRSPQGK